MRHRARVVVDSAVAQHRALTLDVVMLALRMRPVGGRAELRAVRQVGCGLHGAELDIHVIVRCLQVCIDAERRIPNRVAAHARKERSVRADGREDTQKRKGSYPVGGPVMSL